MEIKKDYDFNMLLDEAWSGAEDTLEEIEFKDKEEEFMQLLEYHFNRVPDLTEVNDFLRFEKDYIFEQLGIKENEEETETLNDLKKLIGSKFDDVIDDIDVIISTEEDKNADGVIIKDSENNGYDKIAFVNNEDSTCYCFKLDDNNIIVEVF